MSRTRCKCGRGYVSQHDGKCGNCRSRKQQKQYEQDHRNGKYDRIQVVNRHHGITGEYIGRGTPLGNRHEIDPKKGWDRKTVIELFQVELVQKLVKRDPVVLNEMVRLKKLSQTQQVNLVCSCKPQACHGDVIKAALELMETPKMLYYAGIGSRETPENVQEAMARIGEQLADVWTVRSGFADGADKAFCFGAEKGNGKMENYLPWQGFNGAPINDERFIFMDDTNSDLLFKAQDIAKKFHPNWAACSSAAKKMHTRNVFQVLGHDLKTHSHMVVCWTPRGSGSGGTGQAIRIARGYGIPVFDLAIEEHKQKLVDFVALQERQNFEDSLPW